MRKERVARKERLALQVGIALTAGLFGTLPTAEGAPVLDKVVTAGTQVAQSGSITDVTGTQQNNIVKWTDFSVNQGETVRFDKGAQEKNYLNLVTGPKTSEIAGRIEGGKDVYLVNPHGVIFSHGAQVNVGNLYVSAENTDAALKAFNAGKTAGAVLTAGTANADVVNLGGIAASSVVVNGDNIRFLTDDVQATQVTLQAAKSIVQEQDAARSTTPGVLRAASPSAASPGYVLHAPQTENRWAIRNAEGLAAVKNNLSGSYSLEADLTLNGNYTPIGDDNGAFTGNFDGNFHTISGIKVSGGTYGGLFGLTSGATIQNVGVKSGTINAQYVGGIVGRAENQTKLIDVFNDGTTIQPTGKGVNSFYAGGIVGYAQNSSINKAYNTGAIGGRGGGILGCSDSTTVSNVYNTYTGNNSAAGIVGYGVQNDKVSSITNAYTTGSKIGSNLYTGKQSNAYSVTGVDTASKTSATYSGFDISSSGSDDTVWRIYEGKSLPLLRDFLRRGKGTVAVNYDYTQGSNSGSNGGSDLTLTYNNQDVKLSNLHYTNANGLTIDASKITQDTGSLRNANVYDGNGDGKIDVTPDENGKVFDSNGQMAFYCTSQDGYDLVGNNVYINQRKVDLKNALNDKSQVTKEYDGSKALTKDAIDSLFAGSESSGTGIIQGDTTASFDYSGVSGTFDNKNVGTGKVVTIKGGVSLKNNTGYHNYAITDDSTSFNNQIKGTITPHKLKVALSNTDLNKTYDGTNLVRAAITQGSFSLTGNDIQSEDVSLAYVGTGSSTYGSYDAVKNTFDDTHGKDAGAHEVKLTGLRLTGSDADNYILVDAANENNVLFSAKYQADGTEGAINAQGGGALYASGTIARREILSDGTLFGWKDASGTLQSATREYTGNASYDDANGKAIDTARITTEQAAKTQTGLIAGDDVALTAASAVFTESKTDAKAAATKNAGQAEGVRYTVDITGEDAKNYTLGGKEIAAGQTGSVLGKGSITPRTIYLAANRGVDKTYDGDNKVRVNGQVPTSVSPDAADSLVGYAKGTDAKHQLVNGDGAVLSLDGSTYEQADVRYAGGLPAAQQITYKVSVMQDGTVSSNYKINTADDAHAVSITTLQDGKAVTGIIRPRTLTALTFADVSKTYDGKAAVRGLQTTDKVQLQSVSGIQQPEGGKKPTLGDLIKLDSIQGTYGKKNGDTFTENQHVKDAAGSKEKDVRYTGIQLKSAEGNYNFGTTADGRNITETTAYGKGEIKPLEITDKNKVSLEKRHDIKKTYDGTTDVADAANEAGYYVGNLTAQIPGSSSTDDRITLGYKVEKASYADKNHGTEKRVTYELKVADSANGDYTLSDTLKNSEGNFAYDGLTGDIAQRILKGTIVNKHTKKEYDGTTEVRDREKDGAVLAAGDALVRLTAVNDDDDVGIVAADQGTVSNASTASYRDQNVHPEDDKPQSILYQLKLTNNDVGNYVFQEEQLEGEGTITPREVTPKFTELTKTFDNTTDVFKNPDKTAWTTDQQPGATLLRKLPGDDLALSYDAAFADKNAGTENHVDYTNLALSGAAGNYRLADTVTTEQDGSRSAVGEGTIKAATVGKTDIIALFDPITKIYDGNTNVAYDHTGDAAYDVDYAAGDARKKTAADFLQDGDDAASGTQSIRIKGRALTYGKDYTIAADGGATYAGKDVGKHDVTYRFQLSGTVRRNYDFSQVLGDNSVFSGNDLLGKTQGTITRKTVTAALSGVTDVIEKKAYDGKTTLPDGTDVTNRVTFRGLLAGDAQLGKVTGVYNTKDVARNADGTVGTKDVLYTPSLDGTGAANYQLKLVSPEGAALTSTTLTGAGQGRILPRQLGFSAGYAEKTYDATPEAAVINPAFTGFADGESLTPGTADGKSLVKAQYGLYDGTTFTPDENVEGDEAYKAVAYQNLQQALAHAAGQTDTIKASNYTIADTVYFDKPKEQKQGQGKIKRLALSASDIKERWSSNITKQYDGTRDVDIKDPEKNFQIYIDETTANGTKLKLPKTVYLHYELDASKGGAQYNSKDVKNANEVTYHISGLKNSEKLANNFTFSNGGSLDPEKYKGDFTLRNGENLGSGIMVGDGTQHAVVGITKRVLKGEVTSGHNDKTYNGETAADSSFLVLTAGTDDKSAAEIEAMLQKDGTTFGNLVQANYIDAQGHADAGASTRAADHDATRPGTKQVRYTVSLTDALKDNYAVDKDDTTKTETSYDGFGDIFKRVVYVDFANDKEDTKTYDGYDDVKKPLRTFALSDEQGDTGIIKADQGKVHIDTGNITGKYASAHVKRAADGTPVAQQVSYRGFGVDNANYEVRAKAADGADSDTLVGMGTITPAALHVGLRDANVTQAYDNTLDVEDLARYGEANVQLADGDLKTVNNVRDTVNVKLSGTPQYDKKDANVIQGRKTENRSVTYELTWDNPDYELAVAQDVPSQTLDVTEEISSGGVGTARLVTDAALITPRTVTLAADPAKTATRLYDGASGGAAEHAIGNLEAGNLAKGEKLINLFLAPGATEESYLPETVLRSAYDSDPNAGRDGVAVAGDRNDLRAHTVTYTYTLQNPNYQLDATGRTVGTARGQGVIRRRDVTVTADPVTMAMGHALPVFTGGTSGFIAEDAAVQTSFESGLQFRPEDSVTAPSVGTYGVYGWYRTREEQEVTVPAVLDQDGKTVVTPAHTEKQLVDVWHREGNLGLNYYFQQDAGNDTALTVTRPTADWPRSLEEAFRPAQQYVPDGNAYHRVSYDTHQETNRTPTVGIEYAAGGLNVGAAGAAAAALEGGRDVVNLGGTRAAVVDVTYPGAAEFVVSGERAVPGVTEAAWTKLAASEARGAGAQAMQVGSGAAGALAAQAESGSSATAGATSPAAASRGGAARNAGVPLFYNMEERQPSRLASTAEAQLFGDAVPAAKEAAAAPVKLFADDGAAQHAAAGAAAPARGAVPALFDDAASAAAEQPSSDAIEVTTSPADEDDEQKEKEEAARAAALQAKGAAIGIESEGAGVNLAG